MSGGALFESRNMFLGPVHSRGYLVQQQPKKKVVKEEEEDEERD